MNHASFLKSVGVSRIPALSYIICTNQRTGSSVLCEALRNSSVLGAPREHFLFWYWQTHNLERLQEAYMQPWLLPNDAYLQRVFEKGTTANGVFGVKLMWEQFEAVTDNLRSFPQFRNAPAPMILSALFPNLHYIFLTRADKVRQAVSFAKALQTGKFHIQHSLLPDQPKSIGKGNTRKKLCYNFYQVFHIYQSLIKKEAAWERYFAKAGIKPYRIVYEQFEDALDKAVQDIANYLNSPLPPNKPVQKLTLKKQSDATSEEWVQRFKKELAERTRTPLRKLWFRGAQACIFGYHQYFKSNR